MKYFIGNSRKKYLVIGILVIGIFLQIVLSGILTSLGFFLGLVLFKYYRLLDIILIPIGLGSNEENFVVNFTVSVFLIILLLSLSLYILVIVLLKRKFKKFKEYYELIKDQLYEVNTALVFIFGFFPLFYGEFSSNLTQQKFVGVDNTYFLCLTIMVTPYLYSLLSSINHKLEEKSFKYSTDEYLKERFKK
ncbi:MAG: hypothetical protein RR588_03050 [Solibacillus sp.]